MYDIAIIGGGINGCGIARDAAGRGLSVLLVEMNDLASGTSSRSTKLIHGGLRYLEHYEFMLVRKSLIEREVLYKIAPHIIAPVRFVLPHHKDMRPAWLIRLGLFLYDHIGGRKILPKSCGVNLLRDKVGDALKADFSKGFEYSDCRVDDARLVVLNAMDAQNRGADIRPRTKLCSAQRQGHHWVLELSDSQNESRQQEKARILINAAGPWVGDVIGQRLGLKSDSLVRKVKGSHIVVKKLYDHDRAYIFQNRDNRIIFAIPYERDFTLIGTTDVDITGDPGKVEISSDEISYLCTAAGEYFKTPLKTDQVVWGFAGVRPLFGNENISASELTRDYVLEKEGGHGLPVALTIFGGKITTYRKLAEKVLDRLVDELPRELAPAWTANSALPGGDFEHDQFEILVDELLDMCPSMATATARRLIRAYGMLAFDIFTRHGEAVDMGEDFGAGLSQLEVHYLTKHEWALTAQDILWRRSKLGLRLSKSQQIYLENWLQLKQKEKSS